MYDCGRVAVEAPAKINLSLDITGLAPGGYHLIETVMAGVSLCDVLIISKRAESGIRVTCSDPSVPENGINIAHTAAERFFESTGVARQGLNIHIDKSIPTEAGLAGGSANAAATLKGLDFLFGTSLSPEQLAAIALEVGMDVPFCLTGGVALARGRGELLTPLRPLPDCHIAIAKPQGGMSTRLAYRLYDEYSGKLNRPDTQNMLACIADGDLAGIGRNMRNVFSQIGNTGETEKLSSIMLGAGAAGAELSGSGSAVAGLFDSEKNADDCLRLLRERGERCRLARPLAYGARIVHAG